MNRRTGATWAVLAAVIGAIAVVETTGMLGHGGGESHQEFSHQDADEVEFLVPAPVGTLGAIEIAFEGEVYRFERDATDAWFHHRHTPDEPEDVDHEHRADADLAPLIGQALAAFGRTRRDQELGAGAEGVDYGLATPIMVITLYPANGEAPLAEFLVGDMLPDEFRRYTLVDDGPTIVAIANYQIENLQQLLQAVDRE